MKKLAVRDLPRVNRYKMNKRLISYKPGQSAPTNLVIPKTAVRYRDPIKTALLETPLEFTQIKIRIQVLLMQLRTLWY